MMSAPLITTNVFGRPKKPKNPPVKIKTETKFPRCPRSGEKCSCPDRKKH